MQNTVPLKHYTGLFFIVLIAVFGAVATKAQPITGVWKGKINNRRVEVKFAQRGDSIAGTSYYPGLLKDYRRYNIKGYFDAYDNSIVWWNDRQIHPAILEEEEEQQLFSADYNCPGGTKMFLTSDPRKQNTAKVDLTKAQRSDFPDEWNYVFDNYQYGANRPAVIDSVAMVAFKPTIDKPVIVRQPTFAATKANRENAPTEKPNIKKAAPAPIIASSKPVGANTPNKPPVKPVTQANETTVAIAKPAPAIVPPAVAQQPVAKTNTITDKFTSREKTFALDIPLRGDSVILQFYDNAEVDGDSVALFLNNKLLFEHVLLSSSPFTFKLATKYLGINNDLVMVAENLGTIPPNTAYMVITSGGKKYDAQIVSTEQSSAMVRLKKE